MDVYLDDASRRTAPRFIKWIALFAGFVVLALVLLLAWFGRPRAQTSMQYVVERRSVPMVVTGQAVLAPSKVTLVTAPARGMLVKRLAQVGAQVVQGQPLFELRNPDMNQQISKARQDVRIAAAKLVALRAQLEGQLYDLQAAVQEQASRRKSLDAKEAAMQSLLKFGTISKLQATEAKADAESALVVEKMARGKLRVFRKQMPARAEVQKVQRDLARQRLANLEREKHNMLVKAPAAGVLAGDDRQFGQWIDQGQPLVQIVSSKLFAKVNVSQEDASRISVGDKVRLSGPNGHLTGVVRSILPRSNGGLTTVRVALDTQPDWTRPDLVLDALITSQHPLQGLFASLPQQVQAYSVVQVSVRDHGKRHATYLHLGRRVGTRVQILAGAHAGERFTLPSLAAAQTGE